MPISLILLAAQPAATAQVPVACRPAQLVLSVRPPAGSRGARNAGADLSIRNAGRDCLLPALPVIELRDPNGRSLPAVRRVPVGMHPGPVILPIRLSSGHRAVATLRWSTAPIDARGGTLRASGMIMRLGGAQLGVPFPAVLHRVGAGAVRFDQTPFRAAEGLAGDLGG